MRLGAYLRAPTPRDVLSVPSPSNRAKRHYGRAYALYAARGGSHGGLTIIPDRLGCWAVAAVPRMIDACENFGSADHQVQV